MDGFNLYYRLKNTKYRWLNSFKKRTVYRELLEKNNPLYKKKVKISKFEEKGSDVNIATYMIADCLQKKCDVPVLLSIDFISLKVH